MTTLTETAPERVFVSETYEGKSVYLIARRHNMCGGVEYIRASCAQAALDEVLNSFHHSEKELQAARERIAELEKQPTPGNWLSAIITASAVDIERIEQRAHALRALDERP